MAVGRPIGIEVTRRGAPTTEQHAQVRTIHETIPGEVTDNRFACIENPIGVGIAA
jgi:hypothetical protein